MAEEKGKKLVKKVNFELIHRLSAAVSLLALMVIVTSGLLAQVSFITITVRACLVVLTIFFLTRVIVQILASYEEMNSGKG